MIKYFAIPMVFALAGLTGRIEAQQPGAQSKSTVLVFDSSEHDFGRISENGGKVDHGFGFVNTGVTPVVITDALVSCKCTKVDYPKKPIPPGARGVIRVTYDPRGQGGVFYKAIQIVSSTPDKRQIITIKGEVY